MNERIQELANEAAKFSAIMALPTGESGDKLFVEKFAELIVRECAAIARQHNMKNADRSYLIHKAIKQHFGVKE